MNANLSVTAVRLIRGFPLRLIARGLRAHRDDLAGAQSFG